MYIQALIENTCSNGKLHSEHGLSLYIETKRHKILFDTGASGKFAENAKLLGVHLGAVDIAFLSHGHYDHGGGLWTFLELNQQAPVYIRKEAFGKFYGKKEDGLEKIGLDEELRNHPRVVLVEETDFVIDEELRLFSGVNKNVLLPEANKALFEETVNQEIKKDSFIHEQYLIIREEDQETVISGCSHRGIVNILARYDDLSTGALKTLVGGLHLMNPAAGKNSPEGLAVDIAHQLMKRKQTRYYTCHCTGEEAFTTLKNIMGEQILYISTGEIIAE